MKKRLLFLILNSAFLILNFFSFAQNKNIDSLLTLLKTDKADTNKINHLVSLADELRNNAPEKSIRYAKEALFLSSEKKFKAGAGHANIILGTAITNLGKYDEAIKYLSTGLKICQSINDKKNTARALSNIGIVYDNQGNYPKALDYYLKAIKIDEEIKNKEGIAARLGNIGLVYTNQGDYTKALNYLTKEKDLLEQMCHNGNTNEINGCEYAITANFGNLGIVYNEQDDYSRAMEYYFKALKMTEKLGDKNGMARHLGNIGSVYGKQGDYHRALSYYFKALAIVEKFGDKNGIVICSGAIGSLYTKTGKFKEAEKYLKRALVLSDNIGTVNELRQTEESLSQLYEITGQHKEAFIHYKKAMAIKDTIFSQENKKQLVRKEMNFEFEKKEATTKAENDKQQAIAEEKSRKQKVVLFLVSCVLLLVFVFTAFVFRSLRITRRQKNIIEVQKNEVLQQKEIVEKQKHIVEKKQKEIVDSITYARRIQRALLTSDEYIKNNLPAEHFILYKPKDIVSGDFYWAYLSPAPTPVGEENKRAEVFYIATADCTGHGVPGAFMSMLNISYFNENVIEKGIRMPNDILDAQRTEIIKALNPFGSAEVSRDGMDCVLCAYDFNYPSPAGEGQEVRLHFAAANNPLWLVRNGELTEYKADKMPVGKYTEEAQPFTLQTIELQKGDIIYTSTDGYADQFGSNGKKLMKQKFKEELLKIHHQPMIEQKEYLHNFFETWKGNTEQVDDVTIIGIRI